MALTKETIVDKIEVLEMGQVQVRTATRIKEDGVVLSSSFHRKTLLPSVKTGEPLAWADTDISGEDARVAAICTASWTADVIAAYKAQVESND